MRSLSWKLGGALLLVVIVSIGITVYLINRNTTTQFQNYVTRGGMIYAQQVANSLSLYYRNEDGWSGVQSVLTTLRRTENDRLIVADSSGKIVADTANQWQGYSSAELQLTGGSSISLSGLDIGTLYVYSPDSTGGRGFMGGRGMVGGTQTTTLQTAEGDFLDRVNNYIWIAGIIALITALVLGLILTRQITSPVKALKVGAEQLATGNLSYRVHVRSNDEIGALAKSFNSMAINLDRSEQSRKQIVSDISHELRTPLTIIEGTVDGIQDGVFPPNSEHLNAIKEQTTILTRLVSDLRDLSLSESGQLRLDRRATNMVELVSRMLTQFEPKAIEKKIQLKMESEPDIPAISVDPVRIEQVIVNLLSNAIRHTPPDGEITISVTRNDHDQHLDKPAVTIAISDTGEGIPSEHLPHIFERFYRVENSRSRREGGVGLGLAIVKQMVKAHGGKVWAESEPGKGATFFTALPLS